MILIRVIFLGTSASIPTKNRALPSIMILRNGEQLIFDCGEGVQRQMLIAGVGLRKNLRIFISHMHADHVLGLAGILMSLSLTGRQDPLEVYGPSKLSSFIELVKELFNFTPSFDIIIHKVSDGVVYRGRGFKIVAFKVKHMEESYGYALVEDLRPGKFDPRKAEKLGVPKGPLWKALQEGKPVKIDGREVKPEDVMGPPRRGLKIVYSGDTALMQEMIEISRDADLLIHEATFDDTLQEMAVNELHTTASQAATIAREAGVKKLVLTHISPRYEDPTILLTQAKKIFDNTIIAEDLMNIELAWSD
ncbi:ribonuclease Z [Candidatus Nezhaarchaeota archaeon WYZ-LMO8]|nr:MAG: ribonuclease Z [Candidatus Nezhaarchaeota archaeon WYZ-LMO8]TDA34496.1 MAG: ribonuclease Z [Candidatus Nezhaarchaeota archaeon WYZ-LMO7]